MPKYKDTIIAFEDYFDEPRIARDFRNLRVVTYHDYMNVLHLDRHDEELPVADPNPTRRVNAFVNMGRWVWGCAKCESSYILERGRSSAICTECYSPEWVNVVWPSDSDTKAIESKLLEISGPRLHAPLRNWEPSWTLDQLTAMVDQVHLRVLEGRHDYRSLSIGQTRNWTAGERLTATNMNLFITQLIRDVAGRNGVTEFEDAIKLPAQVAPTSPSDGMLYYSSSLGLLARHNGEWVEFTRVGSTSRIGLIRQATKTEADANADVEAYLPPDKGSPAGLVAIGSISDKGVISARGFGLASCSVAEPRISGRVRYRYSVTLDRTLTGSCWPIILNGRGGQVHDQASGAIHAIVDGSSSTGFSYRRYDGYNEQTRVGISVAVFGR